MINGNITYCPLCNHNFMTYYIASSISSKLDKIVISCINFKTVHIHWIKEEAITLQINNQSNYWIVIDLRSGEVFMFGHNQYCKLINRISEFNDEIIEEYLNLLKGVNMFE